MGGLEEVGNGGVLLRLEIHPRARRYLDVGEALRNLIKEAEELGEGDDEVEAEAEAKLPPRKAGSV